MDYFQENEALLREDDPALLAELEGLDLVGVRLEPSRKGGPTLQVDSEFVHSSYDPTKEAARLMRGTPAYLHIHFGLGLGYLLLSDMPEEDGFIIVFEPNPVIAATAMKVTPLAQLLRQKRARLCCSLVRLKELLDQHLKGDRDYRLLALPYHSRIHEALFRQVEIICRESHHDSRIALRSVERNAAYLTQGALATLKYTTRLPGVERLAGLYAGTPAVIVAAGPSLDRNLCELKPFAERCLVIAIARTARPLERAGIAPHFLVHNEPKPYYQFIDGCRNLDKTAFVLSLQGETRYFEHPHGPTFVFQNPANFTGRWISDLFPELAKEDLPTGGSVATEAFSLAHLMGCDPVVLIGQDLALKEGRYYAHAETNKNFIHLERDFRRVPGYFGQTALSLTTYYSYALWLGDRAEALGTKGEGPKLINATEGGVALNHFQPMKLAQAAPLFFRETIVDKHADLLPGAVMAADRLATLIEDALGRLTELDDLNHQFAPFHKQFQAFLDKGLKDSDVAQLQRRLDRLDGFKQRYVQLQTNLYVLSGFMQAELLADQRRRRLRRIPEGRNPLETAVHQVRAELDAFENTLTSTAKAVVRMRHALEQSGMA